MKATSREAGAALAGDLAALVNHIHRVCATDMLEIIGSLELSISQVKALHLLDLVGPRSLGELAAELHLSPAQTGRAIDDLHRQGLVERSEDAADRRVRRVVLTPAGGALLARLAERRHAVLLELAESLAPGEQTALLRALAPLLERIELVAGRPAAETPRLEAVR
jgi:DNA-binding MarR family transcriptional regulator